MGRFDMSHPFIVALDFDGTIKEGKSYDLSWKNWKLTPGFRSFYDWALHRGLHMVLWTCRNLEDSVEHYAVSSFLEREGITEIGLSFETGNAYEHEGQVYTYWGTGSLKQYADFYVDDLAIGCPLTVKGTPDWNKIRDLIELGL